MYKDEDFIKLSKNYDVKITEVNQSSFDQEESLIEVVTELNDEQLLKFKEIYGNSNFGNENGLEFKVSDHKVTFKAGNVNKFNNVFSLISSYKPNYF
ncbi:hypothetical protein [Lysinibacillus boronitolerans]|uniref:Uncharacterized protein n=1 Tax=Lysinibacillus boronitolerans JCM 21713 = 10a = NBRC 103108 TaxID=1294264 RepID=A0ABR4XYC5_9BACI|nr:hypothetical protein [Lysinibacillus boronitolerans]KGR83192.1 hypothetical protein CD31_17595 [Lysinibacillus boronitolerans JCM 21713 = 10a = NBRC 103108]